MTINPAETAPGKNVTFFNTLIRLFEKKGYSFEEIIEQDSSTLILKQKNRQQPLSYGSVGRVEL